MRVAHIVEMLFREVSETTRCQVHPCGLPNNQNGELIFVQDANAIVGFIKEKSSIGICAILKIWGYCFPPGFNEGSFCWNISLPACFQIIAGPFLEEGCKDPERGRLIIEDIRVRYGNQNCSELEFSLDAPLLAFITHVLTTAEVLQDENMSPKKLSYWEAFLSLP